MNADWTEWLWTGRPAIVMAVVSTVVVYAVIIAYVRWFGLRSFSKMSAFDFAMTIALGTLFGSTISGPSPPLVLALICLFLLFATQRLVALARRKTWLKRVIDNEPLLIMLEGRVIADNLRRARITADDLRAKLREAGVLDPACVKAVVFETTGDVSVLHGPRDEELDPVLLEGVRTGDAPDPAGSPSDEEAFHFRRA